MDDCILSDGPIDPHGYARVGKAYAHRLAYAAAHGPIPKGLVIDHLCRTKRCINPAHLEAVTSRENTQRHFGEACPRGHTGQFRIRSDGARACRACGVIHTTNWRSRNRDKVNAYQNAYRLRRRTS